MGILDNITKNTANYSTKSFYFGMPEAEGENRDKYKLSDYFEDYLEILSELKKGKFIFTGRKGSGKTAIAKYIKDQSDQAKDSHAFRMADSGKYCQIDCQERMRRIHD